MSVAVSSYTPHLTEMQNKSGKLGLDSLKLIAEEKLVDNKPALVIRRKDMLNGGLIFTSNDWNPYPLDDFKLFVSLASYEFFNGLYHQGCFAAGENWIPEMVATKYSGKQIKITCGNRSYYWDHINNVVRFRGM